TANQCRQARQGEAQPEQHQRRRLGRLALRGRVLRGRIVRRGGVRRGGARGRVVAWEEEVHGGQVAGRVGRVGGRARGGGETGLPDGVERGLEREAALQHLLRARGDGRRVGVGPIDVDQGGVVGGGGQAGDGPDVAPGDAPAGRRGDAAGEEPG